MSRWVCRAVLAAGLVTLSGGLLLGGRCAWGSGLSSKGTQGYLGVDIRDVSDEQIAVLHLRETRGAEIIRVDHDGPAGKAGLREHDVILQMNGQAVEGQEQLRRMLRETPSGRTVTLIISRDGQQQTMSARMANREEVERQAWEQHMTVPAPDGYGPPPTPPPTVAEGRGGASGSPRGGLGFLHGGGTLLPNGSRGFIGSLIGAPYTGAMLEPIGPQLAEFFGVPGGSGLLVRSVEVNSPAATAGLKAGDVVLKVNQVPMEGLGDWSKTVHESKGKPVPVTVLREKKEQTLTLIPDSKRKSELHWPEVGPGFADVAVPSELQVAQSGVAAVALLP